LTGEREYDKNKGLQRLAGRCLVDGWFVPRFDRLEKLGTKHVPCSERRKELKRRRHRSEKLSVYLRKLKKATVSERGVIADKIRRLTPGGEVILERLGVTER
jgi:hypothetical protein